MHSGIRFLWHSWSHISKAWPTCVYLRLRLGRACVHLRWLAMTCAYFGRDQISPQVELFQRLATQPKSTQVEWRVLTYYQPMKYRICLPLDGFFASFEYLRGNLWVRLATQRRSLGRFNMWLLATTCESVWPGLYIDQLSKETQTLFSDSFGFKNPILDSLTKSYPKILSLDVQLLLIRVPRFTVESKTAKTILIIFCLQNSLLEVFWRSYQNWQQWKRCEKFRTIFNQAPRALASICVCTLIDDKM